MITDALAERFQDDTNSLMLTVKGRLINPLDPGDIDLEEVAHVLARFRRYGAHTPRPWSVAQHAILCSHLVPQDLWHEGMLVALEALHHDDQEGIIGDWPKPIKNRIPGLKAIEDEIEAKVRTSLGLPVKFHAAVKEADMKALEVESYFLWADQLPPPGRIRDIMVSLAEMTDEEVTAGYLTRHDFLVTQVDPWTGTYHE